jgi:hypothetical protein
VFEASFQKRAWGRHAQSFSGSENRGPSVFSQSTKTENRKACYFRVPGEGRKLRLQQEFVGIGSIGNSRCRVGILRACECLRAAIVDNSSGRKDQNSSKCGESRKSMGNYQERGCREMVLNIFKNYCFAGSVETGSRFVQNENSRLLQNSPRNGKPLTLSPGELAASRPDPLSQAIRQSGNKRRQPDRPNGLLQVVLRRRRPHESKVGRERSVKQNRLTGQIADVPAQTFHGSTHEWGHRA